MSELYHHGVKGQKWGVRRYQNKDGTLTSKGKKHLGIDDKGRINLIDHPTSKQAIRKFIVKVGIFSSAMTAAHYISKHPQLVRKGSDFVSKNLDKTVSSFDDFIPTVYSKTLGRALTAEELAEKGLI